MENINREKILEEIREEIREKGYTASEAVFGGDRTPERREPYSEEAMEEYLKWIDSGIQIIRNMDYEGHNPVKRFFKRVYTKLFSPLFAPLVFKAMIPILTRQECVDISILEACNMAANYMQENSIRIRRLEKRIDELEGKFREVSN